MGLFSRRRAANPPGRFQTRNLLLEGDQRIAAVGESFYQPALLAICSARAGEEVGHECIAVLVLEPDNPHDANAVRVEVDGRQVAHLSRPDALIYRPALRAAATAGLVIVCPAFIAGRGRDSDTPNLGIFLHLPSPHAAEVDVQGAL